MIEEPDEEVPEAIRLHKALAVAILALELIASRDMPGPSTAAATLNHLRAKHPDSHEHLTPPACPICFGTGLITDPELTRLSGPDRKPGDPVKCICAMAPPDPAS
jgi:hypothetical protein